MNIGDLLQTVIWDYIQCIYYFINDEMFIVQKKIAIYTGRSTPGIPMLLMV